MRSTDQRQITLWTRIAATDRLGRAELALGAYYSTNSTSKSWAKGTKGQRDKGQNKGDQHGEPEQFPLLPLEQVPIEHASQVYQCDFMLIDNTLTT